MIFELDLNDDCLSCKGDDHDVASNKCSSACLSLLLIILLSLYSTL